MPLTATAIQQTRCSEKPIKLTDGDGMYLLVNKTGKYWRLDYRHQGKRKTLALGVYPDTSLKDARVKRDSARKLLANGIDPGEARKEEKRAQSLAAANSFEVLAREWHKNELPRWSQAHADRVIE